MIEWVKIASTIFFGISGLVLASSVFELNRQKFRLELWTRRIQARDSFEKALDIISDLNSFRGLAYMASPPPDSTIKNAFIEAGDFAQGSILFTPVLVDISNALITLVEDTQKATLLKPSDEKSKADLKHRIKELRVKGLGEMFEQLTIKEPKGPVERFFLFIKKVLLNMHSPLSLGILIGVIFALEVTDTLSVADVLRATFETAKELCRSI